MGGASAGNGNGKRTATGAAWGGGNGRQRPQADNAGGVCSKFFEP